MKNMKLLISITLLALVSSCMKEPTIAEARASAPKYLADTGITHSEILDGKDPDCLPEYRYRFAFTGIKENQAVSGCICWSYPDWMVIQVDADEPQEL